MFHEQDVTSAPTSSSTLDSLRSTSVSSRTSDSSKQWKFSLGPILENQDPFSAGDEKGDDAAPRGGGIKEKLQEMEVQRFRKNAVRRQIRNELFAPQVRKMRELSPWIEICKIICQGSKCARCVAR